MDFEQHGTAVEEMTLLAAVRDTREGRCVMPPARVASIKRTACDMLALTLDDERIISVFDPSGMGWTNRDYLAGKEVALNADGSLAYFRN
ncbi:hypothetical protein [Rhizobiales bacterium]|uniref:hypothetical protein n=1 Tax=Ensifer sp. R-19 TaxID=3404055 RepID=UPI000DDBCDB5